MGNANITGGIPPWIHSFIQVLLIPSVANNQLHVFALINTHSSYQSLDRSVCVCVHCGAAERAHERSIWRLQVPPMFNYSGDQSGLRRAH